MRLTTVSAMPADNTQHQQLCFFQLLFRLDVQCSSLVFNFNNSNINQQLFLADECKNLGTAES
jgi:hypothetical protein